MRKKTVKRILTDPNHPFNKSCSFSMEHAASSLRVHRGEVRQARIRFFLIMLVVVVMAFIDIKYVLPTATEPVVTPESYFMTKDVSKILDPENILSTEERKALLEAADQTNGSIYKIVFCATNEKNLKSAYNTAYKNFNDSDIMNIVQKRGHAYAGDTIVILYNKATSEYALYPMTPIAVESHIFDLVDTTGIANDSSHFSTIGSKFIISTSVAYAELWAETPAEVYTNVFEYATQHGYSPEEITARINDAVKTRNSDAFAANIFLMVLGNVLIGALALLIILPCTSNIKITPKERAFIEKCFKEVQAEQMNAELEQQEKERAEKEAAAQERKHKKEMEHLKKQKMHPFVHLIESIETIQSSDKDVNDARDVLLQTLKIAESVFVTQKKEGDPAANRFQTVYLQVFQDNIDDILFHAKKHSTQFDTEEEIPVLMKTFELYNKILNKYIDNSEIEGTQKIGVNLTVIEQLAAMEGYSDSEF